MKPLSSHATAYPPPDERRFHRSHPRAPRRLGRCAGFQVDSPDGRVGVVEYVGRARPGAVVLVVRTGLFKRKPLSIPIDDVIEVVPARRRVVVRTSSRMPGGSP
jgi:hypothetical protein